MNRTATAPGSRQTVTAVAVLACAIAALVAATGMSARHIVLLRRPWHGIAMLLATALVTGLSTLALETAVWRAISSRMMGPSPWSLIEFVQMMGHVAGQTGRKHAMYALAMTTALALAWAMAMAAFR